MSHSPQLRIPATYMRGGTSKGVFFRLQDLPEAAREPGAARDALLMRVIGSPDPYGKHTDGMGGATSSTSKCVIVSPSTRPGHDVDYLYGQVAIDTAFVDWSGNCGNLSTAVGPFAIASGIIDAARLPRDGVVAVRVWQANIGKTIVVHVPVRDGEVQETGDFELDGVTFPAAEIDLLVRAMSMGKLHHAMMGTAAVAIATAAAIPGTLVNRAAGGGQRESIRFGHPSGTLQVGAQAEQVSGQWVVRKAVMSRSARVLMEGWVRVPG